MKPSTEPSSGNGSPSAAGEVALTLVDAASRDGITIGLIDAIITLANTLNERVTSEVRRHKRSSDDHAWHSEAVLEALADLRANKAVQKLLFPRDEVAMDIIHRAAARLGKLPQ